ncbi:hypothetical protein RJ639_037902 [Escallonia herrerae]|uniref:PROP1-like PPR domain-containing protein n=1 Tax=Escallonia herrerae TaxID=1293975 RepID=A0AA88WM62_9ASTE|nr:hypothetical protein RJ639_037902 [Escallonia herrerae]
MALLALAKRFQRTSPQLFPYLVLESSARQHLSSSSSSSYQSHFLNRAFHQTGPLHSHAIPVNLQFSSLQPSHSQNFRGVIDVRQYLHKPSSYNEVGVNELLESLKRASSFHSEEEAFAFLDQSGVKASEGFVNLAIWGLRDQWKLAFLVFKWGEKWGCNSERNWSSIIWVLGCHKKFSTAWCLIRDINRSSMDTRRAMLIMIDRYAAGNHPGKAIQTFHICEKFSAAPDLESFYTLLNALCRHGNIEEAEEFMLKNKKLFPLETEGFNVILNGWCNISVDVFEAKRVWREMSKCCILPNATSYTHMISCFSKTGNLFDSLRLYDEMKKRDWVPGMDVYNSLIYILSRENCLKEALKIVDIIKDAGLRPDSATYNSMIVPLCEVGKLEEARNVLATMTGENVSPNMETYHAFLEGASLEGTLEVLNRMKKAALGPSKDTFLLILAKFFKLEQPKNALKIWSEMRQYDIVPEPEHYKGLLMKVMETRISGFKSMLSGVTRLAVT